MLDFDNEKERLLVNVGWLSESVLVVYEKLVRIVSRPKNKETDNCLAC